MITAPADHLHRHMSSRVISSFKNTRWSFSAMRNRVFEFWKECKRNGAFGLCRRYRLISKNS